MRLFELKVLFAQFFPKKSSLGLLFTLSVTFGLFDLFLPFLAKHSIDSIFPSKNISILVHFAGWVSGIYGIQWGLGSFASFLSSNLSLECARDIRVRTHANSLKKYSEGDALTATETAMRIESDALSLVHFILRAMDILGRNGIALAGSILLVGHQDFTLLFLFLLYFAFQWVQSRYFSRIYKKNVTESRSVNALVFEMLREHLIRKRLIFLLGVQTFFEKQFLNIQNQRFFLDQKLTYGRRIESFLSNGISFLFKMGIGFYLAKCLMSGTLTAGQGAFLALMLPKMQSYYLQLSGLIREVILMQDGAQRVLELFSKNKNENLMVFSNFQSLEFKRVSFSRENKEILRNLSFEIKSLEKVVFFGPTGSGKTTVWLLILGLLKPSSGEIFLNGKPLDQYEPSSWHRFLSIVPQDNELFRMSIKDNVSLGRDGKKISSALPNFLSLAESRGEIDLVFQGEQAKVSTGEMRVVMVARGVWNDAPILLFDEPEAHWDDVLSENAKNYFFGLQNKTMILFTHRKSWIQNAQKRINLAEF